MKSAKVLADEIQALQAKVQAIQAIATQEARELLDDEQSEIDTILGPEGKPGQIENLAKQRERAIKIEQAVSNTVRQHVDSQPLAGATFRVPATARYGKDKEDRKKKKMTSQFDQAKANLLRAKMAQFSKHLTSPVQ